MSIKSDIEKLLKSKDISYRFIPLPADLPPDIPSHAAFHGISLAQAMATIIYRTEKGLLAAVKRADTQIDEEKLKQLAGVQTLEFASQDDLSSLDVETGLVPYLGLTVAYCIDKKVLKVGKIYGTTGDRLMGMAMEAKDLQSVNPGMIGDFTYVEKTIDISKGGKRILSGITPSGDGALHIGNYLGAVRQFVEIAKKNECFLFVADLHALTTVKDKAVLQKNIETLILNELALLGDLSNITFYRQSDIGLHPDLTWMLSNVTPLGLIKRAHAYKDKLQKDTDEDDINMGLFSYPVLMAADILLYKPDFVPVGKDQKQHIEITRDIAEHFNKTYKKRIFPLPDAYIPEEVAVVLGTDGKRKMSKSLGNIISIFESEDVIKKQVMGTYTDPTRVHATDPGHIEGNMVFHYLDFFGEKETVKELKTRYIKGKVADVEVKEYLYKTIMERFAPARARYEELKSDKEKVKKILKDGAEKARAVAAVTMKEVRDTVGLTTSYSFAVSVPVSADGYVTIDQFAAMELRVGNVETAEIVEGSQKLIRLRVDFGDGKRTVFTGVRQWYDPAFFAGKQFFFITNLAPRRMMNEMSEGMILAVDGPEKPLFLEASGMPVGSRVR